MTGTPSQIEYYARALRGAADPGGCRRLGDQARDAGWSHEEYLAAVLSREVSAREASGAGHGSGPQGSRPARPRGLQLRSPPALNRNLSPTWAPACSSPRPRTWSCSGRPAPARPTWRSASASRPPKPGTGCCSTPPPAGSPACRRAHSRGKLASELVKLRRYGLLVVDEVGYIPFEQDAANLFFQLVSSRYEHASMILTSNLPFARWGDVFGDQTVASAMIDRIVHHADVISLKGNSYRLKKHRDRDATLRPRRKRGKLATHTCSDLRELKPTSSSRAPTTWPGPAGPVSVLPGAGEDCGGDGIGRVNSFDRQTDRQAPPTVHRRWAATVFRADIGLRLRTWSPTTGVASEAGEGRRFRYGTPARYRQMIASDHPRVIIERSTTLGRRNRPDRER